LPWEDWITPDGIFAVNGKSVQSTLFSVSDCQAIVKKAIVKRLGEHYGIEWFKETAPSYTVEVSLLKDIVVVTREQGSGSRDAFEELMKLQEAKEDKKLSTIAASALVAEGTGTVMATVASKEGAIGFVSLGFTRDTVKIINIDGIKPTARSVVDGTFPISRPLLLITKKDVDKESEEFINFILSEEGQEIISNYYIPVKNELR
jgi:ABC-type phosphate transport system substrate-binding protein